jgi:tetraacyldisaccharide-1-P 4'-kinase
VARLAGACFMVADGGLYHPTLPITHPLCLFNPQLSAFLWPLGHLSRPVSAFPQALWWAHQDAHAQETGTNSTHASSAYHLCEPRIAESHYAPCELMDPEGRSVPLTRLHGALVQLWVGIARAERVTATLEALGAEVYERVRALNHRNFPARSPRLKPQAVRVCTYKDLARVPRDVEMYVLRVNLEVRSV